MLRFVFSSVALSLFLGWTFLFGEALTPLAWSELANSRGGSTDAKECKYTCNAYNGYINQCPTGAGPCDYCTGGGAEVTYTDAKGQGCSDDAGYKVDQAKPPQPCGFQVIGMCGGVNQCDLIWQSWTFCKEPPVTLKQKAPIGPHPPGAGD